MEQQTPLLTTSEVAERFKVSEATVTRWARTGALRALKFPGERGSRRFRPADVEAFVAKIAQGEAS